MYKKVSTDMNFAAREQEVLNLWKEKDIVRRSFHLRDDSKELFTFFDGPPTANGKPHIGHVLTRAIKDLFPRYQTMKGKSVLRIAGWDTHGLPVELEVEKKLGLDGKEQIEAYGIEPFIKECKESVWKYLTEWENMSDRVGYWVDMEHPYITYHDNYIESEWWSLKKIWEKDLIYKGHKIVPYCPRCGTALSSHEVAQGYKDVKEFSAFVRFKATDLENTYFLAWTTTPWTLPSNVALCVNKKEDYTYFMLNGDTMIMADALIDSVFSKEDVENIVKVKTVKGSDLVGMGYEPLYDFVHPKEKAWYIVEDNYVTLTDGTGIVHIAPAFGEDDARVGRDNNLPFVQTVDTSGKFTKETTWAGTFVKDADAPIMEDLKARKLLLKKALYEHSYPFCWRCDTPLIYYARPTWFIKMTALKDNLVKNNRQVNWMPENIKEGRMGNFLENVVDWGLSRERYWGTPLPIWQCEEGHTHVIGSKEELLQMAIDQTDIKELHRPYIDEVKIKCPHCNKPMTRVKEVIDCWYDSGSMPFAQWHYPFENKENFEKNFPAEFISEAVDQTRGWFYTLMAIGTLLFDKAPFENCIVLGHVQDKDGKKMSKHLGNVIAPSDVLDEQGADAVRWYFYSAGAPWLPSRFSADIVKEVQRKFMGTLLNTYAFFVLYADLDQFDPKAHALENVELTLMDKWVLSKLNTLIEQVDNDLANYRIPESTRKLTTFVDDLSNWYVRRGRERFWGKGMAGDKEAAFATLYHVLVTLSKLLAPYIPFMAESMYQNLVVLQDQNAKESVHFCDFPVADPKYVDKDMERQMDDLLVAVQLGRSARNLSSIKIRQPISTMYVTGADFSKPYEELLQDELNIKNIEFLKDTRKFTTYLLKPQMRTLGPKYGKLLGKIGNHLKTMDGNDVVDAFNRNESVTFMVDDTEVTLNKEDVLTSMVQKEGFMAQSEGNITVVLDTNLTDDLIMEGFAREMVSKVQQLRKDMDFTLTDRIHISYVASPLVKKSVEAFEQMIASAVLALSITNVDTLDNAKTVDLNGETVQLALQKA